MSLAAGATEEEIAEVLLAIADRQIRSREQLTLLSRAHAAEQVISVVTVETAEQSA